jgi:hypothetical protein
VSALIWLAVPGKDNYPVRLDVDASAKEAADEILTRTQPPSLVPFQRDGEPIWVNPANVLYIEEEANPATRSSSRKSG